MLVGIDFDNTIVSYDALFHRVALEAGHIPPDLAPSKLSVRDYLRTVNKEHLWTEMQGYVYGARMREAEMFPGVIEFLAWARRAGVDIAIISHRTQHPFIGPRYDLHRAAHEWIASVLQHAGTHLVDPHQTFFETTREGKLKRIAEARCNVFVDDLPEVFLAPQFPERTTRILFDPDGRHSRVGALTPFRSWEEIRQHLEARWSPRR